MLGDLLNNTVLLKRVALALGLLIMSGVLGTLLGRLTAPQYVPKQLIIAERKAQQEAEKQEAEENKENDAVDTDAGDGDKNAADAKAPEAAAPLAPVSVPVYYHVGVNNIAQWPQVLDGLTMAKNSGVHRYILPAHFSWEGENPSLPVAPIITELIKLDPEAEFILQVDLNPSAAWLQANPDDVVQYSGESAHYPSPASPAWRDMVNKGLTALVNEVSSGNFGKKWGGVIFTAMDEGLWRYANQYDRSKVNSKAFLNWLTSHYENIEFLEAKWQISIGNIEAITIPPEPDATNTMQVFLPSPNGRRQIDYLRYSSETVANTIKLFARQFKDLTQSKIKVFAPYGYNLETTYNAAGHFAQEGLLDGPLDGIVGTVSSANRGLGGTGGMMGPLQSARIREKQWLIVDDTRTGLQRDPNSGAITRMEGLRASDVHYLQERNFAMAFINGEGLVWSDPNAEGRFVDEEQWGIFKKMHQEYQNMWRGIGGALPPLPKAGVMLVVDDESRFYQQCDVALNEKLLVQARDAVLMAGTNAQVCLLNDVLNGVAPAAPAYVFLNAFSLNAERRTLLHNQLAQNKAAAIWMYAPGYIKDSGRAENISELIGMNVKELEGGGTAGSVYRIAGPWISQDKAIGESQKWKPLFYIEDDSADPLATYQDTNKTSIAMKQQEAGWTSVYIADPFLSSDLFREVMRIVEQNFFFRPGTEETACTLYAHPDYIAVHAAKPGDKIIDFGKQADAIDIFDDNAGWQQKRSITLPMKVGETRVLKLKTQ